MIFDKPDSVELLDAVNHFLNEKIKDEVPPHLAFKLRIVENVLNIVGREIALGEKLSQEVIKDLRDLIESEVFYNNSSFSVLDSAGIRETKDVIAGRGI